MGLYTTRLLLDGVVHHGLLLDEVVHHGLLLDGVLHHEAAAGWGRTPRCCCLGEGIVENDRKEEKLDRIGGKEGIVVSRK